MEHRVRAEALERLINGSREGLLAWGLGLIEPEDAEVSSWVEGAQAQHFADKVVESRCILPEAVSVVVGGAKEPKGRLVDGLHLKITHQAIRCMLQRPDQSAAAELLVACTCF